MKWILDLLVNLSIMFSLSIAMFNISNAHAEKLNLTETYTAPIGQSIGYYTETDRINASQAYQLFRNGHFQSGSEEISNYGIGSNPVWISLSINNPTQTQINRIIHFDNYWLDEVSAYWLSSDRIAHFEHQGDLSLFYKQPTFQPSYNFQYSYPPGITTVLIRLQTLDAMVIPVYLFDESQSAQNSIFNSYSYGFLYGAIIALLIYNFILFLGLRLRSYFYYCLYLLNFLILNMAYSGHGSLWLWPNSPYWQQWAVPILMVTFCSSGIVFACHFLRLRYQLPLLHKILKSLCVLFPILMLLAVILQDRVLGLIFAFDLMLLFSGLMIVLGVLSLNFGNISARLFLLASISSMIGIAITALAVWSYIPFNDFTYRAAEIGVGIDVLLLALALTERFRRIENEKLIAEKMAQMDPLTLLNNRRAFYQLVEPQFNQANGTMESPSNTPSIVMIDIDKFKDINDKYGHIFGDLVLVKVASIIRDTLRKNDIVARWGGEEFIVFLPQTAAKEADSLAMRICENIAKLNLQHQHVKVQVTASIGIVTSNAEIYQLPALIEQADKHLYQAKRAGRNRICNSEQALTHSVAS
ncbi:diguanylate cyclase [Shewanella sp. 10N.286.52.B9]|uniref:diguanylate cyclase n=2 Tax=unclassified Shewanella TaxID=196818 RepID=UPI000C82D798|nr:diguanylate cyclase [Shewanella sp. 10N.286.52.B9]PMG50231.1 hypothetical protein BCU91_01905 [Shewanella sp. 10N.286.52.B9]